MQLLYLAFSILHLHLAHSLEVTPNSKYWSLCASDISTNSNIADGKYSGTSEWDVVCEDYQLAGPNSTVKGRQWKECMTCELSSTAVDLPSKENELYWVLSNMKFSFDWCVFAYPSNPNITAVGMACAETCQGPNNNGKAALVDRLLQTNATLQYQYCETENGAFSKVAESCIKCLEKVPNSKALSNYVKALNAACTQKPALGKTLKLDFDLFPVASTPSATQSGAVASIATEPAYLPPSAVSVISASAVAAGAAQAKAKSDKTLRLGLGVGLTLAGVVAILAILGFVYGGRRAKRNRMTADEQARARWEADDHARQQGQQQQHYLPEHGRTPEELDTSSHLLRPTMEEGRQNSSRVVRRASYGDDKCELEPPGNEFVS